MIYAKYANANCELKRPISLGVMELQPSIFTNKLTSERPYL